MRQFHPRDLEVVVDIGNRAWQRIYDMFLETYGTDLFEILIPDRKTQKGEQVRAKCTSRPQEVLVCESGGAIIGFVTFSLDLQRKIGQITNNAADPSCKLQGIGQSMYAAVFEIFRAEGMKYAKVTTGEDWAHAPARRAYERAGFDIPHSDVTYHMKL